jgi:hypothetical protein
MKESIPPKLIFMTLLEKMALASYIPENIAYACQFLISFCENLEFQAT